MAHDSDSMRLLIDSIPALVFTLTAAGEVEWANRPLLEYFDRTLEELKNWRLNDSIHADDLPHCIAVRNKFLPQGRAFEFKLRMRRADGVYRWFHYRTSPFRDAEGRLVRWYGTVTDIDDLQRAHEALRASADDLRLWIDSIPALVYTANAKMELQLVSRQVLDYFGRTLEELKHWDEIGCVHPDDMPRVVEGLKRAIEFGEPNDVEQRLRRADGTYRWFKPATLALRDSQGQITRWYGLLSDIDDLKRAEEGLRIIQARFSRAAHLATMSELAASIAHEINQPIAAISATAHACLRWLSSAPPNLERACLSAERIVRDASSAADVVSRIRSLFKRAPAVKQLLNINAVIEEACDLMAADLRARSISLRTELATDLPETAADPIQLQHLLANLIRNAAEAMEPVQDRPRKLDISSQRDGDDIVVRVTDCGVGLSAPEAVFDPFYTTKPTGMGMGLAICRAIIEAHDGRLWTAPNTPHGTTFAFSLRISSPMPPI